MAGGLDGVAQTVGRAVGSLGGWEGPASASFAGLAAGYAAAARDAAVASGRAVEVMRRYGEDLQEGRERVRRLQRAGQECLDQIEVWQRRAQDAAGRERTERARAQQAATAAAVPDLSGVALGVALAESATASIAADDAEADRIRAERRIEEQRDELARLRKEPGRERDRVQADERRAAGQLGAAVGELPVVTGPGAPAAGIATGAGPVIGDGVYRGGARLGDGVYRGGAQMRTADLLGDLLDFSRETDRKLGPIDEAITDAEDKAYNGFKDLSGITDAEKAAQAARRGDLMPALGHGALALPFGKLGKAGKLLKEGGEALAGARAFRGAASGDTRRLTNNVLADRARQLGVDPADLKKPAGAVTHHIVPKGEYVNRAARGKLHQVQGTLDRLGIGPDDAPNGAFLDKASHQEIHTNRYFEALNNELRDATSRQDAERILRDIGREVRRGQFPH